jgi:Peroxidase
VLSYVLSTRTTCTTFALLRSLSFSFFVYWIVLCTERRKIHRPNKTDIKQSQQQKKQKIMRVVYTSLFFAALAATTSTAFVGPSMSSSSVHRQQLVGTTSLYVSKETLDGAQVMIDSIIDEKNCNPFFVRLAWHDSGTFDVSLKDEQWPKAGGAIGSIRFEPEIKHGANNGLSGAIALLEPVKEKFPEMSYADIFQMASARSIELASGPKIDMKYVNYWLFSLFLFGCDHFFIFWLYRTDSVSSSVALTYF